MTVQALTWNLIARDNASATFTRVGTAAEVNAKRISSMGTAAEGTAAKTAASTRVLGGAAKAMAGLGFTVGAAALAFKAFELGSQFQKQMLQVQTLTGGTSDEVRKMSAAVLGMAGQVGAAPDQLAVSLYHVESVGLRGAKALNVVETAAKGAKIGMADLEQTTNALTSTVASGIPGVENMQQAMGQLIAIVGAGDMKMSDLNEALGGGILSVVKGYGLSLTDVGAALATFGDNNIRGADAATALRMAVQSLAVPAAKGKAAIESIGLTMTSLQKDMQHGGLNQAILDLNKHMQQAGITGNQVGGFLTEAFGKRAGIGLSVLMGQVDRFESKMTAAEQGGRGFADKWTATTHTVGFAFDSLKAKIDSALIRGFEAAAPSISAAVNWFSTTLPKAIKQVLDLLSPLAHEVGSVLVVAWHGFAAVLKTTASALAMVGRFASANKGVLTDLATAALASYAAIKILVLGKAGILVLGDALITAKAKVIEFAGTLRAVAAGEAAMSMGTFVAGAAAAGVAAYAVGKSINAFLEKSNSLAHVLDNLNGIQKSWTDSLDRTNGALTAQISKQVAAELQADGLAAKAAKAHISLNDLTAGVTGNDEAWKKLIERWKAAGNPNDNTITTFGLLHNKFQIAKADAVQLAGVTNKGTDATIAAANATPKLTQFQKDLAQANKETQISVGDVTYAMKGQATEADILTAALARLSGDKNAVAESQLALEDSLNAITEQIKRQAKQYKDHGTSLRENTVEGRANLEWMHQQIDAINSIASGQIKNKESTDAVTSTLAKNEAAFRKQALAAGFSTEAVDAFIKKWAATPKKLDAYIIAHTDTAATKALALQKKLDKLTKEKTALIKLKDDGAPVTNQLTRIQNQINALNGAVIGITITETTKSSLASTYASQVPKFHARGGSLSPGWNVLGEEGEEMVNRETGRVLTAAQTSRVRPRGNTTVNVAKQELHVHYPLPGTTEEALPNLMRAGSSLLAAF